MEYKKYELLPYHLHVIHTEKFKTVTIKVCLKRPLVPEEITIRNLLGNVLLESTEKHPSRRYMGMMTENLYGFSCQMDTYRSGNYMMTTLSASFLDEKYTEPGMLKKSIQFLIEILSCPNVQKGAFDEHSFNICKEGLKAAIESYDENPTRYAKRRLLQSMEENATYACMPCGTLEDLENITPQNLYEYYESVMKSDLVDIFVCGNVNGEELKNMLLSEFHIKTIKKPGKSHMITHNKYRKRCKITKESRDITQSILMIGCKLDHPTEYERKYVMGLYNHLLGGGGDSRLYQTVREKHSLCYSIYSSASGVDNLLYIQAGIDKDRFKKTTELIRKEMKKIALGDIKEEEIEKYITMYLASCKEIEDSPNDLISLVMAQEYLHNDPLEVKEKEVLKLTKEMVVEFASKVRLDTIYLLEGEKSHEETTTQ